MLKASNITKRFGSSTVPDQVSFSVPEGEVPGLIGPNGAGRTTLFECLAGLLTADAGEVVFRDGAALPAPVSGKVGLWSKTDSVSYFDDFTITPTAN